MDTTTEFEISAGAAESFAVKVQRPDKEDNIRIERLAGAPTGPPPQEKRVFAPRREDKRADRGAHRTDKPRDERAPKPHGKPHGKIVNENGSGFVKEAGSKKKKRH